MASLGPGACLPRVVQAVRLPVAGLAVGFWRMAAREPAGAVDGSKSSHQQAGFRASFLPLPGRRLTKKRVNFFTQSFQAVRHEKPKHNAIQWINWLGGR